MRSIWLAAAARACRHGKGGVRTKSKGKECVGMATLSVCRAGKEALRAEDVRLRPVPGVVVDAPDVDVHPRAFGQIVSAHLHTVLTITYAARLSTAHRSSVQIPSMIQ